MVGVLIERVLAKTLLITVFKRLIDNTVMVGHTQSPYAFSSLYDEVIDGLHCGFVMSVVGPAGSRSDAIPVTSLSDHAFADPSVQMMNWLEPVCILCSSSSTSFSKEVVGAPR